MVIEFSAIKHRAIGRDPRMLLQAKGKVLHLPQSSERLRACGCTRPVPNALMRLHPEQYRFTLVSACLDCGELAEFDTSALEALADLHQPKPTCCDSCHLPSEQVTKAEMESPDGVVEWAYLCDSCIEQMDDAHASQVSGRLPW